MSVQFRALEYRTRTRGARDTMRASWMRRCSSAPPWHLDGDAHPDTWIVRATFYGPSTSTTRNLPYWSVVFVTWGSTPKQPYARTGLLSWVLGANNPVLRVPGGAGGCPTTAGARYPTVCSERSSFPAGCRVNTGLAIKGRTGLRRSLGQEASWQASRRKFLPCSGTCEEGLRCYLPLAPRDEHQHLQAACLRTS